MCNVPHLMERNPWPVTTLSKDTLKILDDIMAGLYDSHRRSEKLAPVSTGGTPSQPEARTRHVGASADDIEHNEDVDGSTSGSPGGKATSTPEKNPNVKYFVEILSGPDGPLAAAVSESGCQIYMFDIKRPGGRRSNDILRKDAFRHLKKLISDPLCIGVWFGVPCGASPRPANATPNGALPCQGCCGARRPKPCYSLCGT